MKYTSAIITDASGSLGAVVFSTNKGGKYTHAKVKPTNPQSAGQTAVRNSFGDISSSWRVLTENQRQSWIQGAKSFPYSNVLGLTKLLSGSGLYIQLNRNLDEAGQTRIVNCPQPEQAVAILTMVLTATAVPALSLAFTPTPIPADTDFIIEATPQLSAGISFVKNLYRKIYVGAAADTSPSNILAAYQAKFGSVLTAGSKIFVRAHSVNSNTGEVSTYNQASTIVV